MVGGVPPDLLMDEEEIRGVDVVHTRFIAEVVLFLRSTDREEVTLVPH